MLTEIPLEINELISKRLHVCDRAKMFMALPKNIAASIPKPPASKEKQLASIYNAVIRKRKITKLSHPMKKFLESYDPSDPTVVSIYKELGVSSKMTLMDVAEHIENDTLNADHLKNFTFKPEEFHHTHGRFLTSIYKTTPDTFQMLMTMLPEFKTFMQDVMPRSLMFNVFNYGNEALFLHLRDSVEYQFDMPDLLQYVAAQSLSIQTMWSCGSDTRSMFLKYLRPYYNKEALEEKWLMLMESMDIDAANDIEKILSTF